MRSSFKLVDKNNPQTVYRTSRENFLLGRSNECEIVINDPHISRVQAKLWLKNDQYFIENLGKNPIYINSLPTHGRHLSHGDIVKLGASELIFQPDLPAEPIVAVPLFDDKTVALSSSADLPLGPRLVMATVSGTSQVFPLDTRQFVIGRAVESNARLDDPSVSRRHCVIEKTDAGYIIKNLSETNPVFLNGDVVAERQMYSGDQLRIGNYAFTFISDLPEDAKPAEEKIITRAKGPGWLLWLGAACLLLILGSYVFYWHIYRPWTVGRNLAAIEGRIDAGDYLAAQEKIKILLNSDLTAEQIRKATEMLSNTALAITSTLVQDDRIRDAQKYLIEHLADYGAGEEALPLWDRLDYYRVSLGQQLESRQEYHAALSQYAAIREDGPYYEEAQNSIKRIWLAYQQQQRQNQTLSQLFEEAEAHFRAKRYLTPMNQNAYSAYQAVLSLDPQNSLALERIDQIKSYYRDLGDRHFAQKNWLKALTFYERYSLIDSESSEIKDKIRICKQKLATAKIPAQKPKRRKAIPQETPDEQRQKIKKMLEESGTDSSWIMKYLFEEKSGEKDSEKPW